MIALGKEVKAYQNLEKVWVFPRAQGWYYLKSLMSIGDLGLGNLAEEVQELRKRGLVRSVGGQVSGFQ